MTSNKLFYPFIILILTTCYIKVSATDIIPCPTHIQKMPGSFLLSSETMIVNYGSTVNEANFLKEVLKKEFNLNLVNSRVHAKNAIYLILNSSPKKQFSIEGYELIVNKEQIKITANHAAGIFYAIQTLRQLIIKSSEKIEYTISCIKIMDQPSFKWREFMLDESRHFQGADVVKRILDEMAFLKMNTFHWHLTDNQGWRIEIKKYPNLTIIGSKRDSSEIREGDDIIGFRYSYDNKPHEGFYTQQQIKDIIQFASSRHITIIPEIEMPDHSVAAIASYQFIEIWGLEVRFFNHSLQCIQLNTNKYG